MRITTWIVGALLTALLLPGCGLFTGRYKVIGQNSAADFWLPAPKDGDGRQWTEAALTSVETGEQKIVALQPPLEPGGPQYVAKLEHGFWHIDLVGEDLLTGEAVFYSLHDLAVTGESVVLDVEAW